MAVPRSDFLSHGNQKKNILAELVGFYTGLGILVGQTVGYAGGAGNVPCR